MITKFFLAFSHTEILLPLILCGLFFRPKIFLQPTLLLLFTMIFSAFLKSFFAIPYSEELVRKLGKTGFSFPSGHMQLSAVFYGWFLLNFKNNFFRFFLIMIISGIAASLILEGYHNIYDMVGGLLFAALTIILYKKTYQFLKAKKIKIAEENLMILIIFLPAFFLIFLLFFFYQIRLHSLLAFEMMAILWFCFRKRGQAQEV